MEIFESIYKYVFILGLVSTFLGMTIFFIARWQSRRYLEIAQALSDLHLSFQRMSSHQETTRSMELNPIMTMLAIINENTKNLNFKTQLLDMRIDENIKQYHLAPQITPKQEQVLQRRRRARSKKKPPIARGPKDVI